MSNAAAGQSPEPRLSDHLAGLDGIRGLAILMVMALHFVGDAPAASAAQRWVVKLAGYGLFGVDLFFVLSGFLITGILVDAKGSSHYFRNFYARRTLRIFPLYYLVLALLLLLVPVLVPPTPWLNDAREHQAWLWTYTSNFYVAATSSWSSLTYFSHFWSLAIEEQFYLCWPLIVFSLSSRTLERVCIAAVCGSVLLRIWLAYIGVSELSISVLTPCRIDTLCLGAYLSLRLRDVPTARSWVANSSRWLVVATMVLVGVMALSAANGPWRPMLHQVRGTAVAALFGALILVALRPKAFFSAQLLQSRPLCFFGKYSYGLYVYHGLLTWFMAEHRADERMLACLGDPWLVMLARVAFGVGVSLAVAMLSFAVFEKPFLGLKRHFEMRRGAREGRPVEDPSTSPQQTL